MRTHKPPRSQKDWGLPTLTVEEFAREVGATPQEISVWLSDMLYTKVITASHHSRWTLGREPISPAIIRLYIRKKLGLEMAVPPPNESRAAPPPKRLGGAQHR